MPLNVITGLDPVIWHGTCGERWPGRGPAMTLRGPATRLRETVTVDQVRDAVIDLGWRDRATRAPAGGIGLVAAAMRMAWPCDGPPREPREQ